MKWRAKTQYRYTLASQNPLTTPPRQTETKTLPLQFTTPDGGHSKNPLKLFDYVRDGVRLGKVI